MDHLSRASALLSGIIPKAFLSLVFCFLIEGCNSHTADAPPVAEVRAPVNSVAQAVFKIIATDRGFEAPSQLSAGLRHIVFVNHGSEVHEAMLVKLPAGMTADAYVNAVRSGSLFPAGALDYSGPGLSAPGETSEVWLTVDPGNYILICWNGDHPSTVPVHGFTVIDDTAADDVPPKADVVLKLFDFRFELEGVLKKGVQVIQVLTPGPSMHEVDLFRMRDGSTVADLNRWRKLEDAAKTPDMPPPADPIGGLLDSHDIRRVTWLRRTFSPGRYVFMCEMPMETADGMAQTELTHADVGMMKEIEVAL